MDTWQSNLIITKNKIIMADDLSIGFETGAIKKRPPKLKPTDRTLSVAVDNYSPQLPVMDGAGMMDSINLIPPPANISPTMNLPSGIFYVGAPDTDLGHSPITAIQFDDGVPISTHQRKLFRRSDTLDIHSLYQMRKTHSFHANETSPTAEDHLAVQRQQAAAAGNVIYSPEFGLAEIVAQRQAVSPIPGGSNNRRNCRMHRSLYDPHKKAMARKEKVIDPITRRSLGDDIHADEPVKRRSPKFSDPDQTELFVTPTSGRSIIDIDDQPINESEFSQYPHQHLTTSSSKKHLHQHSSHSLEKQYSFKRGGRFTHSFYLSPSQLDEQQPRTHHRSVREQSSSKKSYSSSMKMKPYRESLTAAKKSKSFVMDTHPELERSPHQRRDSRIFTTGSDDIKRSPRISSNLLLPTEGGNRSFEKRKSSSLDNGDLDYDAILRSYRQARRQSSIMTVGSPKKGTASGLSGKKKGSLDNDEDEDNSEANRKHKKIVCIIMTVFLGILFASVLAVIITLTHTTVEKVSSNKTSVVYTFARPIHYNRNGNS